MSSTAAATVAFVGADEPTCGLAASFLRSGARVRCFAPEACPLLSPFALASRCGACNFSRMITISLVFVQADRSALALSELGGVRCATPAEAAAGESLRPSSVSTGPD
jgi:hypothetical protein